MAGKGDRPRPVDGDKYRANYDSIFKKRGTWSTAFTDEQHRQMYELPQYAGAPESEQAEPA